MPTVMATAQQHIPPRPIRVKERRPALSTSATWNTKPRQNKEMFLNLSYAAYSQEYQGYSTGGPQAWNFRCFNYIDDLWQGYATQ